MLTDCFKTFTLFLILICFAFHATFSCIKGNWKRKGRKKYEHLKKTFFSYTCCCYSELNLNRNGWEGDEEMDE